MHASCPPQVDEVQIGKKCTGKPTHEDLQGLLDSVVIYSPTAKKSEREAGMVPKPNDAQNGYSITRSGADWSDVHSMNLIINFKFDLGLAPILIKAVAPKDGVR